MHRHLLLAHSLLYTHRSLCFVKTATSCLKPHSVDLWMHYADLCALLFSVCKCKHTIYHGHPKQLAISMQLLEYIQATIAFHPYGSGPQMVCLAPKLVVLFLWSAIFLNIVNTLTCEATLTLPTNFAWVYVQKHMHKTHMQIPQNVLCRLCTRLYA